MLVRLGVCLHLTNSLKKKNKKFYNDAFLEQTYNWPVAGFNLENFFI